MSSHSWTRQILAWDNLTCSCNVISFATSSFALNSSLKTVASTEAHVLQLNNILEIVSQDFFVKFHVLLWLTRHLLVAKQPLFWKTLHASVGALFKCVEPMWHQISGCQKCFSTPTLQTHRLFLQFLINQIFLWSGQVICCSFVKKHVTHLGSSIDRASSWH